MRTRVQHCTRIQPEIKVSPKSCPKDFPVTFITQHNEILPAVLNKCVAYANRSGISCSGGFNGNGAIIGRVHLPHQNGKKYAF